MDGMRIIWSFLVLLAGVQGALVVYNNRPDTSNVTYRLLPLALRPAIEQGLLKLCLAVQRASSAKGENVVIAPLSIAAIQALLLAASSGVTKMELETIFGIENVTQNTGDVHLILSEFILKVEKNKQIEQNLFSASGLFPSSFNQISPEYIKFAKRYYQSDVIPLDYSRNSHASTQFINSWVSNKTEGKIDRILEEDVDPRTSLVIANAFHFKGSWEQPFNPNYTKMQNFKVNKKEVVQVPMMVSLLDVPYSYKKGSHAVLGLPYRGGDLSMYFVLPESDLRQYVDNLTIDALSDLMVQTAKQKVIAAIPRIKVEGTTELSKVLYSLGLKSIFNRWQSQLDLLGSGSYVSEMIHKVTVELSEWGTEAAATTTTVVHRDGSIPIFRVDRPFLFFIHQKKTNAILFWGTVYRPQAFANDDQAGSRV